MSVLSQHLDGKRGGPGPGPGRGGPDPVATSSYRPAAPPPRGDVDFLANWRGVLDERACKCLEDVGVDTAAVLLADVKEKMDGNQMRNPSAYVMKAVQSQQGKDGGFPQPPSPVARSQPYASQPYPAQQPPRYDPPPRSREPE